MSTILSAAAVVVSLALSTAALIFARQSVNESRASRNLSALMDLYRQSMSDDFRELRGRLVHTDEFDGLATTPYGPRHQEIHRLLGLYEMIGAFTRHGLVDATLVFTLFPRSIVTCHDKTRAYIEHYRIKADHPWFADNFDWLAGSIARHHKIPRPRPSAAPAPVPDPG